MPLHKYVLLCISILFCLITNAQNSTLTDTLKRRCATMEVLQDMLQKNPGLKEQWRKEGAAKYQAFLERPDPRIAGRLTGNAPYRTTGTEIVIPVVVHISIPSPWAITDRDVQEQIDQLNIDYAGLNPDKNVITPEFKARFGSSRIRFALARKDPSGNFTSGIERLAATQTFSQFTYNNVKHSSNNGGIDAWDVTRYYNVWVTRFSDGVLGISTFPYTTPANEQGTVINHAAFGNNPCYVRADYNMGRTLVHETGHFFYLYHIWGDDKGACSGNDFDTETGYDLPAACLDDTPNQGDQSSGYLGGYITDNCATTNPGINYQNYMDYTDDVSYGMFTTGQVCRMEAALTIYRSTLAASDADIPPAGITDAALAGLTPGGRECAVKPVVCGNTPLTATLRNLGSTTLTKVLFTIQYDGVTSTTYQWTGSLERGGDAVVALGNMTAAAGSHTITVFTSVPNNGTDNYTANDTLVRTIEVTVAAVSAPLTESFESTTFPPNGWHLSNPDNSITWARQTNAATSGTAAAVMTNYNNAAAGQWDDLISPPIDFSTDADSATLTFNVAHRAFRFSSNTFSDGLEVWISSNCGNNYTPVYRKSSVNLSTVSGTTTSAFTPTATQWRKETIDLTPYLVSGQKMTILFRSINGEGNNIYIDDININKKVVVNTDAAIQTIDAEDFLCASSSIHPSVTLANKGINNLTTATISYRIDAGAITSIAWTGNLATNDSATITLPALSSTTGQHQLIVWASQPNSTADQKPSNDTLVKGFSIFSIVGVPVTEGFEGNQFPPEGWGVYNPDNKTTWQKVRKATTLTQQNDTAAAVISSFGYIYSNATDEVRTPVIQYSKADSLFLLFDVAASYNSIAGLPDTLQVLVTSDCGASYQSVYKKWGVDLQTVTGASGAVGFVPATSSQYRRDSINLTALLPSGGSFQVVFRSITNGRNNVYIDNINIKTRTLPEGLKQKGYLIYPNPTPGAFVIQHYVQPTTLTAVTLYDMAGRRVYAASYLAGQAPAWMPVDISRFASGIYLLKLWYTDHTVTDKILKQR